MFEDLATQDIMTVPTSTAGHKCPKCRGTGKYTYGYVNLNTVECGKCRGTGSLKTSPEQRLKARASAAKTKAKKTDDNLALFTEQEPAAAQWLINAKGSFGESLLAGVRKYGSLTDKQLAAVYRIIADDEDRQAARERKASQTQLDMSDLLHRFNLALQAGIKRPKIITHDLMFSLAPPSGKNAGHIYVKGAKDDWGDRLYLGKVTPEGRFYPSRECAEDLQARISKIGADVVGSAKAHGAQHSNCCFCGRGLTTDASVSNGYGPECAANYGLPWDVRPEFKAAKAALKQANEEAAS